MVGLIDKDGVREQYGFLLQSSRYLAGYYIHHLSSGVSTQRRSSSLLDLSLLGLLLSNSLGQKLSVLGSSVLLGLSVAGLEGLEVSLALQSLGSDETLDLRSLGVGLVALGDLTSDDKLADIVLLGKTKELSDVVGTLGSQTLGHSGVSQTLNLVVSLLENHQGQHSEVRSHNASTDRLSLALTSATGTVARVAVGQEQTNTGGVQNSLLHGESLLVVTSGNLEDVSLELITKRVSLDLLAHALVVENAETVLVVNLDELLGSVGRIGNVELHLATMGGMELWCREKMDLVMFPRRVLPCAVAVPHLLWSCKKTVTHTQALSMHG